jgi:putative membrane protein
MHLLTIWLTNTFSLLLVSHLMQSVRFSGFSTVLVTVVVLGMANALIRSSLLLLTLPITLLTLGAFAFLINGFVFWLVSHAVSGFHVKNFWAAVGGSILYKIISWALRNLILGGY